jgi:phosphoserine aminotransferase
MIEKPNHKPTRPFFSSGPCAKHKDWSLDKLSGALLGRSHRSKDCKARLQKAIDDTREILQIPDSHRIAIVPASDTGAMEMAMWSMLGQRGVDVFAWESFSHDWVVDIRDELEFDDVRVFEAPEYGVLPDLAQADFSRDIVFPWNGTTSGVRVPNADWIPADRQGLTFCDATSALFAQKLDWEKLDITTYSWQKLLGGEAAHGMLILGPRAVERLETYKPNRPLPKLFRMTKNGKLIENLFKGETINTPSMLCVEDYLVALDWVRALGGLEGMMQRADDNQAAVHSWIDRTDWLDYLAKDPAQRTNSGICVLITEPRFAALDEAEQRKVIGDMVKLLEDEKAAFDIAGYRTAPPSLRIWAGGTVEREDLEKLFPWVEWGLKTILERNHRA